MAKWMREQSTIFRRCAGVSRQRTDNERVPHGRLWREEIWHMRSGPALPSTHQIQERWRCLFWRNIARKSA